MQENNRMNSGKNDLPSALQSLELAPLRNSDRQIWYQAGLEAGRKRANSWRVAAVITIIAAGMAMVWEHRPAPTAQMAEIHRIVPAPEPAVDNNTVPSSATASYVRLIDVLTHQDRSDLQREEIKPSGGNPDRRPSSFGPGGDSLPTPGLYPIDERG